MPEHAAAAPLLSVRDLVLGYRGRRGATRLAVNGVSFDIRAGETLGLVGESGSGKTTIARAIQGLIEPLSGSIMIEGTSIHSRSAGDRRSLATRVQTVFQDPLGSLNPTRTVGASLIEPLRAQKAGISRGDLERRATEELKRVGLSARDAQRLPREFSGGQRQRIAIARALINRPRLVICDEAVSALDLSIQAQILNLLQELQEGLGISYLFITHDLSVVHHVATRTAVLQEGRLVDLIDFRETDESQWAPYTVRLFESAPVPDPARQRERRARFEQLMTTSANG